MHILVVDDEIAVLHEQMQEIRKVFPEADIHEETNPLSALAWSRKLKERGETLSYAFLDVRMREMDGIELARYLRMEHRQVVLLFCSAVGDYALEAYNLFAKGYLLKPVTGWDVVRVLDEMVPSWRETGSKKHVRVQAFGHFDIYVNGRLLYFEREKAKELLALLIDRQGAALTTEQIASVLWESKNYNTSLKNAVTKVVASLRNTLKAEGIEDLLIKRWNHLAVDTKKFECDAYEYEKQAPHDRSGFRGDYMTNYSWAEFSTGRYMRMDEESEG